MESKKPPKKRSKKRKKSKSTNLLLFTSLFFITNSIAALYKQYYLYSFLFGVLTITSLIVHSNNNIYANIIDKIGVAAVILYGSYLLYNKFIIDNYHMALIIVALFIGCNILYIYGYMYKQYCFHSQKCIANNYHGLLHLIASIGHHFIIFM